MYFMCRDKMEWDTLLVGGIMLNRFSGYVLYKNNSYMAWFYELTWHKNKKIREFENMLWFWMHNRERKEVGGKKSC